MVLPFTTRFQTARVAIKRAGEDWDQVGDQALFYWDSIVAIPRALRLYKQETLRLIAEGVAPAVPTDDSAAIWEQGMLLAQDMPLAQVLAEMARYRRGVLRCDPRVSGIRVSGAISLADTDAGLALLARTLPVRLVRRTPWWVVVEPRG